MTAEHGKKVAVVQSNYIPWKGYFDLINSADEFVLYDGVQYTKRDWRNRNKIKTQHGTQWLSIPVFVKGKQLQKIKDVKTSDSGWAPSHWKTICRSYAKAKFFKQYEKIFEAVYLSDQPDLLTDINRKFINCICELLNIKTKITTSMDYHLPEVEGKNEKLLHLCKQMHATTYISGPAAKGYLDEELFRKHGVPVTFYDYSGYPEYSQLHPPFDHFVSVIDLIFNEGPEAPKYMKSF